MRTKQIAHFLFIVVLLIACGISCNKPESTPEPPSVDSSESAASYEFGQLTPITDAGMIDRPYLVGDSNLHTMHLTWLLNDTGSQRIQYGRFENGELTYQALLSEQEGTKAGGGKLAWLPGRLMIYWINIKATGGLLRYRVKPDGENNFTPPSKLNQRNEARSPALTDVKGEAVAYFFIHPGTDWELVANFNFSEEDEPTIDVPMGTPYNLQVVSDSKQFVGLAYFERESESNYGRIAFLKSKDGGHSFLRKYLFDDLRINNLSSFFQIARSVDGNEGHIHIIYTVETPDMTTLYYARSDDDGENFTIPVAIFTSEIVMARSPLLLADGKRVLIFTADASEEEGPAVRYVYSEDSGNMFSRPAIAVMGVSSPESMTGAIGNDGKVVLIWDDISADIEGEQLYMVEGQPSQ